jgi:hypothetical protein
MMMIMMMMMIIIIIIIIIIMAIDINKDTFYLNLPKEVTEELLSPHIYFKIKISQDIVKS